MHVYALCTGYIELDRASMVSDLKPGQPWFYGHDPAQWESIPRAPAPVI